MEDKKLAVRSDFQEFAQDLCGKEFGQLNSIEQGLALTKYYVTAIHNRTAPFISEEELDYACVDGANDLGADMIFRDDGVVYIYQGKYLSKRGATQEEVENFQSIFERLTSPKTSKNRRLADKLSEINWETDSFVLKFICLGKIEGGAKIQCGFPVRIPESMAGLEDRLQLEFLDEAHLNDELRCAVSQTAGIPKEITIHTAGTRGNRSSVIEVPVPDYPSYVLVVPAVHIVEIYKRARNQLFTFNIRNYIGSTTTNKGIIATALTRPQHFFHFNNGVSCLAKSVAVHEDGRVVTDGLQVINGAQTVKALVKAAATGKLQSEACVLMRITQVGKKYSTEGPFANDVTRFNNTQNVIKISDFRSNDSVQVDLAEKFADLRKDGKKVDYLAKRTDQRKNQAILIRFEEFAKVCYSYLCDPVRFSGSTSFLFDLGENGGYRHVFGDGNEIWTKMPTAEFRLRCGIWWMSTAFAEKLKVERKATTDTRTLSALERKWFVIYAARIILEQIFGEEGSRSFLIKHWQGEWKMGAGKPGLHFQKLYDAAKGAVLYAYDQDVERPAFSHRNWMRSISTAQAIKSQISRLPMYKDAFQGL